MNTHELEHMLVLRHHCVVSFELQNSYLLERGGNRVGVGAGWNGRSTILLRNENGASVDDFGEALDDSWKWALADNNEGTIDRANRISVGLEVLTLLLHCVEGGHDRSG